MKKISLLFLLILLMISGAFAFDVISSGQVSFISNDADLNGDAFLVTGIAGFDKAGTIQASRLKTDDAYATKDFSLSISDESYSCDYSYVNRPYDKINTYYIHGTTFWTNPQTQCASLPLSNGEHVFGYFLSSFLGKYYCVIEKPTYNVGSLSSPQENFALTFKASNGDQQITSAKITSLTGSTAFLRSGSDTLASVKWSGGGLKTTESCPLASTDAKIAIQNVAETNTFSVIESTLYDDYKSNVKQLENVITAETDLVLNKKIGNVQSQIDFMNGVVGRIPSSNTLSDSTGKQYTLQDISGVAKKRIVLLSPFTLPLFILKVNADYVGVVIPSGKPDIISVKDITIKSGIGAYSDVTIKNIGTGDATFRTTSTCANNVFSTTDQTFFSKGQTKTVKLFFNSNTVDEITSNCVVSVIDLNNPDNKDTANMKVTTTPILQFEDGFETCIGDKLVYYESNRPVEKLCTYGCTVKSSGVASCNPKPGETTTPTVQSDSVNIWLLVSAIILGLVASGAVMGYTKPLDVFKIGDFKVGKIIRWMLIIGVFIAVLLLVPVIWAWFIGLFSVKGLFG